VTMMRSTSRPARRRHLRTTLAAATATALLTVGLAGAAVPASADEPTTASAAPVADGLYRLHLASDPTIVLAKKNSCDDPRGGGSYTFTKLDPERFSQKWLLKRHPNGTYTVASECQPTVFMTMHDDSRVYFEYGTNGRVGEIGAWDPYYNYDQPHSNRQEWWIYEEDGHLRVESAYNGSYAALMDAVPTN